MFDADDVIHFATMVNIRLVNQTVLAEVISPFRHQSA
jgi:hypothetical protein